MSQYAFDPNRRIRRYLVVELRPADVPGFIQQHKGNCKVKEISEEDYRNAKEVTR